MNKTSHIIFVLALGTVLSCSKQGSGVAQLSGGEIRFSAGAGAELITKAADEGPLESGLDGFSVYGWNTGETKWSSVTSLGTNIFNNVQVVKSSDSYVTVGDKKYWSSGNYHFVAYGPYKESSPATYEGFGSSFVLKFADYKTSGSLDDLVYSEFATDKRNADGVVELKFHHALSRILFKFIVKDSEKMVENSDSKITLIEIEPLAISLGNFYTKASFTYNGTTPSWTGLSEMGNIANSSVVKSEIGYDAYVLPQTLTSDATFSFTYNIVYHSSDTEVKAGPFTANGLKLLEGTGGTWTELQMGMQYSILVNINVFNGEIEIGSPEEVAWETVSGTIETK